VETRHRCSEEKAVESVRNAEGGTAAREGPRCKWTPGTEIAKEKETPREALASRDTSRSLQERTLKWRRSSGEDDSRSEEWDGWRRPKDREGEPETANARAGWS
jgi:hypothetical protein